MPTFYITSQAVIFILWCPGTLGQQSTNFPDNLISYGKLFPLGMVIEPPHLLQVIHKFFPFLEFITI